MAQTLNEIMEFDHVIRVKDDGSINDELDVHAPEIILFGDEEGQVSDADERDMVTYVKSQGWSLLTGWTGLYLSGHSPIMHPSEFIGGGLADYILETPGLYAAVVVDVCPFEHDSSDESENVGWAIAYRECENAGKSMGT